MNSYLGRWHVASLEHFDGNRDIFVAMSVKPAHHRAEIPGAQFVLKYDVLLLDDENAVVSDLVVDTFLFMDRNSESVGTRIQTGTRMCCY